jgi:predicted lipid carrier protein YhbT
MPAAQILLPPPIGSLLKLLPAYPGSLLLVAGLNLMLRDSLPDDVQRSLVGKRLQLKVIDAHLVFDFTCTANGFSACENGPRADLTIAASAHDFLLLARRQEDPDTLFFSRRLVMEGDTELGLLVKNTLDALQVPVLTTLFRDGLAERMRLPAAPWRNPPRG